MGAGATGLERLVENYWRSFSASVEDGVRVQTSRASCDCPHPHMLFQYLHPWFQTQLKHQTSALAWIPYWHPWNQLQGTRSFPTIKTWPYSVHGTQRILNKWRQRMKAGAPTIKSMPGEPTKMESLRDRQELPLTTVYWKGRALGPQWAHDPFTRGSSFSTQWTIHSWPPTTMGAPTLWR